MSVKRRERDAHGEGDRDEAGRRANAPGGPYRVVMVASPESVAWRSAAEGLPGVLMLDPFRVADAALLGPLQPPTEGESGEESGGAGEGAADRRSGAGAIPRWAVYDSAEVPGALLAILRTPCGAPDAPPHAPLAPLDPLAVVLATPHPEPGTWHLFGLHVFPPSADKHAAESRVIETAIGMLGARRVSMTLPRSSPLLDRPAGLERLGAVERLTTHAPLHGPEPAVTVMLTPAGAGQPAAGMACDPPDTTPTRSPPASTTPGTPGALLDRLEPFVVAPGRRFPALDMRPLGVDLPPPNRFDLFDPATERFLSRIVHLDRLTFGKVGMPMPAWLFNDISAMPGAITGLGLHARDFPPEIPARLGFHTDSHTRTARRAVPPDPDPDPHPDELIPLSMFIAVPARPPHVWYGHNLASLNAQVPELGLTGLGGVTKAMGLSIMRCTEQLGATQWDSNALHVHTRFGPLELLTAWTPAHANPATLTYRLRITEEGIAGVLAGGVGGHRREPGGGVFWIEANNHGAMRALQARIERGERFFVAGPPVQGKDGITRVPVERVVGVGVGERAGSPGSHPTPMG